MNMFAGIETTVSTLGWTIDRLAVNQDVQDRIFDEVSSGSADLPYSECLINEAMRYFPPIPFLIKNIEEPRYAGWKTGRPVKPCADLNHRPAPEPGLLA